MIFTLKQMDELKVLALPVAKFLRRHCNSHTEVVVEADRITVVEAMAGIPLPFDEEVPSEEV